VKAIILSAGQGRRLLPYTESTPKCLLPVDGERPALEVQLRGLAACGVTEAWVMVGFQAEKVEAFLATNPVPGIHVETAYNPFFDSSDNLVTAWLARPQMQDDFLLMNGDTLFEPAVLRRLLTAPMAPITLVINGKNQYDSDDMKVSMSADGRLRAVSKTLKPDEVDGESIGLMRFTGVGVSAFRDALDRAVRTQHGLKAYYLSVIDALTREIPVETASMTGLWWGEMDSPEDLMSVRADLSQVQTPDRVVGLRNLSNAATSRTKSNGKKKRWLRTLP
jgi:choline kinase